MKTLSLALLLCLLAATPAVADPADSGMPSIEDLQKQLDQKKASTPKKHRRAPGAPAAPAAATPEERPRAAAAPPEEQPRAPAPPPEEPADDRVRIAATVPYDTAGGGPFDIGADCKWTGGLVSTLVRRANGKVQVTDQDLERVGGRTLKLTVLAIHTAAGGAFSGRKWATLQGQLRIGGRVAHQFRVTKSSTTDPFRFSSCSVADKLAGALGEFAADWLKHPVDVSEPSGGGKERKPAPPSENPPRDDKG